MANEINFSASLTAFKAAIMSSPVGRAVNGLLFTMSGNLLTEGVLSVGTSATAIPLGAVTAPHWAFFNNLDATNFVTLRNGSGGADLVKLKAGEPAFFPLPDTATPYAVANTAPCLLEYLIFSL